MIPNNMNVPNFTNLFKVYLLDIYIFVVLKFQNCIFNLYYRLNGMHDGFIIKF
jgi:hypothetical protein